MALAFWGIADRSAVRVGAGGLALEHALEGAFFASVIVNNIQN